MRDASLSGRATVVAQSCPQPPQNRSPGSLRKPHWGHGQASACPHAAQNSRSALLTVWHCGHGSVGPRRGGVCPSTTVRRRDVLG